ncbi:CYTH domain-containing protein [Methylobacterium sp. 1030]|uniref:CYTH domain-containing protein n=1 Tax=Methylobacterium sp. 1030 TaxID=3156404 RepID=UPI003392BCC7
MRLEIERKFLVAGAGWRDAATSIRHLKDGLVGHFARGKVRVRLDGERAWLTVKGAREGIARAEFEYEIPHADGAAMVDQVCTGNVIEKIRYCVPHDGLTWEVDVFQGSLAGMVLAEVELARADQFFSKPAWLGEEVTGDLRFRQSTLLHLCREAGRPITMDDVLRLPVAA